MHIRTMNKVTVEGRGDAYTQAFQVDMDGNGCYPIYFIEGEREEPEMIHHSKITFFSQPAPAPNLKDMYPVFVKEPGLPSKAGFTPSIIPDSLHCYPIWYEGSKGAVSTPVELVTFYVDASLSAEEYNRMQCKRYCEMLSTAGAKISVLVGEVDPGYAMICSDPDMNPLLIATKLESMAKILRQAHAHQTNNKTSIA